MRDIPGDLREQGEPTMGQWLHDATMVLEFVPPPKRLGREGLEQRLGRLERLLEECAFDAVNLPEIREEESRSDDGERTTPFEPRFPSREIALEIRRRFGIPAIVNHVVAGRPRRDFIRWVRETHERYGVEDFVLVGPAKRSEARVGPTVPEANEIIRGILPTETTVGNICIPGRTSAGVDEAERMEAKARSGVDFFTTQIVYHSTPCLQLLGDLAARSPLAGRAPILVSLCPLRRKESIRFLRWLGVELDEPTAERLTADPDAVLERSIDYLIEVWRRIREGASRHRSANPLGLNIAPVGPMPRSATVALARALTSAEPEAERNV